MAGRSGSPMELQALHNALCQTAGTQRSVETSQKKRPRRMAGPVAGWSATATARASAWLHPARGKGPCVRYLSAL